MSRGYYPKRILSVFSGGNANGNWSECPVDGVPGAACGRQPASVAADVAPHDSERRGGGRTSRSRARPCRRRRRPTNPGRGISQGLAANQRSTHVQHVRSRGWFDAAHSRARGRASLARREDREGSLISQSACGGEFLVVAVGPSAATAIDPDSCRTDGVA